MNPLTLYLENQTTKLVFISYIMVGAQGFEHLSEESEMLDKGAFKHQATHKANRY